MAIPPDEAGAELSVVHAELSDGRAGAALVAAIAAWRKQRAPELAELVELVGRQVDRSMAPLVGTRDAQHARWLELAALRRPADLGRLLAALPNTSIAKLRRRFALLAGYEPDPRMVEHVLAVPMRYSSYDAIPLLNAALDGNQSARLGRLVSPRKLEPNVKYVACVVPTYRAGATWKLERMLKAEALVHIAQPSFHFSFVPTGYDALSELVRHSDCYRLEYSDLDDALDRLLRLTDN